MKFSTVPTERAFFSLLICFNEPGGGGRGQIFAKIADKIGHFSPVGVEILSASSSSAIGGYVLTPLCTFCPFLGGIVLEI